MLACEENCNFATQIGVFACNQVMSHILKIFLDNPALCTSALSARAACHIRE